MLVQLGSAPLLGPSTSADDLRLQMIKHDERLATAAQMLGMSTDEYRAFRASLASKTPAYGVLPRHLAAMAFYREGGVRVLQDVIIPAQTYGWEVDIKEADQTLRVLVPATCGNMSIIRQFHPVVATRSAPSRVLASSEHGASRAPMQPPSPSQSPSGTATPLPTPTPLPSASPLPSPSVSPSPPIAIASPAHHFRWPWLLPIVLLFFHGGSSGSGHPIAGGGGGGCGP